jgi:hypothetical protein
MLYIIIIHVHNYLLLQVCTIRYLGDIFYRWNLSTSRFKAGVTQHLHMHHPRFPVGWTQFWNPNLQNLNEDDSRGTTTHETHTEFLIMSYKAGSLPGL